jgi:protein ImuB
MHWIALAPPPVMAHGVGDEALQRTALGWWALQFTPYVAWVEEALLLEVQSCLRLWGGRQGILQRILESNPAIAAVNRAQAATSLVALARLRCRCAGLAVPAQAKDLPLPFLSAAQPHLHTLSRLGLRTWGQLRALPRDGVARRFGAPLLAALDTAYGQTPERYPWLQSPECFNEKLELMQLEDNALALMPAADALLRALQAWLQARTQGVLALELTAHLDVRKVGGVSCAPTQTLSIRTAQATQAREHLARLAAEHLARTQLPAPAHSLSLRSVETAPLPMRNHSLLAQASQAPQEQGENLQELLERLRARLGRGAVLQATARKDHRPEHMTAWVEVENATKLIANNEENTPGKRQKDLGHRHKTAAQPLTPPATHKAATQALPLAAHTPQLLTWPTWLLRQPLPLLLRHNRPQYQGALRLLAGPQRIEAGWWGPASALGAGAQARDLAARDYFIAHSPQAGLLWVYRERLPKHSAPHEDMHAEPITARWFLHGVYS